MYDRPLTVFAKNSFVHILLGPKYACRPKVQHFTKKVVGQSYFAVLLPKML